MEKSSNCLRSMHLRINLDCPSDFKLKFDQNFLCTGQCHDMMISLTQSGCDFQTTKKTPLNLTIKALSKSVQSKSWLSNCQTWARLDQNFSKNGETPRVIKKCVIKMNGSVHLKYHCLGIKRKRRQFLVLT